MSLIQAGHFVQITPISGLFQSDIYSVGTIFKQSSLITITLQNINITSDVKTLLISSNGYVIKGETQKYQLRFESDLAKLQSERTSRQIGTGSLQFAMTGVEPIDLNILVQMDDQTLTSACQTDKYISELCKNDILWKQRIDEYYPDAEKFRDDTTSRREFYIKINGYKLNQDGANFAAINGHLDVLKWMAARIPSIYPNQEGINNGAAYNGRLDVLKWMASLDPPILPDQNGANKAGEGGHLDVSKWMASLNPPILPNDYIDIYQIGIDGRLDVLKWLSTLNPPILLYDEGADYAADEGHLDILKWLSTLTPPIHPTVTGANYAVMGGNLEMLKWMASLNPPVLPNIYGLHNAAMHGDIPTLGWAATLRPPLLPDTETANFAAAKGQLETLKWMASFRPPILPDIEGANYAVREGQPQVLQWMASLNPPVLPTT